MSPTIPQSENGGISAELRAVVTLARQVLADFRRDDDAYVRGLAPRPDFIAHCHALAAAVNRLLKLIDKGSDDVSRDDV